MLKGEGKRLLHCLQSQMTLYIHCREMDPHTIAAHAGRSQDRDSPLNTPITLASNHNDSVLYSRCDGTATWQALEESVAQLEGGRYCVAYASGMAGEEHDDRVQWVVFVYREVL
jgi:hypothetical protein